jgi:hypothetical protein
VEVCVVAPGALIGGCDPPHPESIVATHMLGTQPLTRKFLTASQRSQARCQ